MPAPREVPACLREMFTLSCYIVDSITLNVANEIINLRQADSGELPPEEYVRILDSAFGYTTLYSEFESQGNDQYANVAKALSAISAMRWSDDVIGTLSDDAYALISECPLIILYEKDRLPRIREFVTLVAEEVMAYLLNPTAPTCPVCKGVQQCYPPGFGPADEGWTSNVIPLDIAKSRRAH